MTDQSDETMAENTPEQAATTPAPRKPAAYSEGVFEQGHEHLDGEHGQGVFDQGHAEPEGQGVFDQGQNEAGEGVFEQGRPAAEDV